MEINILGFLVNLAALIMVAVRMSNSFERRLTRMEASMNGHKEVQELQVKNAQAQLAELALARKECQDREQERLKDHETRLRELQTMAHVHEDRP